MEGTNITQIIDLIIGFLTFLAVFAGALFEYHLNKKIETHTGESSYYKILYDEYLIKKVPEAMSQLKDSILKSSPDVKSKQHIDTDLVMDVINNLIKDSFFAKCEDTEFYDNLNKIVVEIEEMCNGIFDTELDSSDAAKYYYLLEAKVAKLYKIILNKNL